MCSTAVTDALALVEAGLDALRPRLRRSMTCHHGFRVESGPDGRWHTHRPDGTEILINPDQRAA